MREHLADLTQRTISWVRNTYWFIKVCLLKGGFLLFYFLACVFTGFNTSSENIYLINFIVVGLDVLVNVCMWILINSIVKNKLDNCYKPKKTISYLKLFRVVIRLAGTSLLFVKTIIHIESSVGSLTLNILVLLFSIVSILFVLIKEFFMFLFNYFRYKAKKEIVKINNLLDTENIE